MKKIILILFFSLVSYSISAQEIMANVQVMAPQIPNLNKRNIDILQNAIRDFMNNNKWTNEVYLPQERINCNFIITITSWDGNSNFKAEAQIQSTRPIYGSGYNSLMFNYNDKAFDFSFVEGQPIIFSDQNFSSNISSLLTYYAYTIIGIDKDSFSNLGGNPYFNKALNVVNFSQNSGTAGWRASEGLRNRFWLNQNMLDNSFNVLRVFIYDYHRNGLDKMQENKTQSINHILNSIGLLQQLDKQKMGALFPNIFLAAKADEFVNIFKLSDINDRIKAFNLLIEIDPANQNKYQGLIL